MNALFNQLPHCRTSQSLYGAKKCEAARARENVVFLKTFQHESLLFIYFCPHNVWDLSFMTRDRTRAPCRGSVES